MIGWIVAAVLFFALWVVWTSTPAPDFLRAALKKRPLVLMFYPEGRLETHVLNKNEEYGSGIIITLKNGQQLAYVRAPNTVFLFGGKIRVYVVYVPFGSTAHPGWALWLRTQRKVLKEAGVSSLAELFAEIDSYEKTGKAAELEEKLNDPDVVKCIEQINAGKKPDCENIPYDHVAEMLQQYRRYLQLKAARDKLQEIMEMISPQTLEPLAKDFDAAIMGQLMETAAAREREKWIKRLERIKTAAPIVGILMAGGIIMIILLALINGGGGINILHAGQQVAHTVGNAVGNAGTQTAAHTVGATATHSEVNAATQVLHG